MKKTLATLFVTAAALASSPAFAQASGSVVVSGNVAAKCVAVTPITGTISLGELATTDGTVDQAFSKAVNGTSRNFTVRCNGANPQLSVDARPLVNAAAADAPTGYTNTVNYTAKLSAKGAKGGSTIIADASGTTGATTDRLGDRLAAGSDNITLTIENGTTAVPTALLEAGDYSGSVNIVVAPNA